MISETEIRTRRPAASASPPDPAWAWAPYVPDARRPWDLRQASHLYRRAALMPRGAISGLSAKARRVGRRAVAAPGRRGGVPRDVRRGTRRLIHADAVAADTSCQWWLRRMIQTPHPLQEKLHAPLAWTLRRQECPGRRAAG